MPNVALGRKLGRLPGGGATELHLSRSKDFSVWVVEKRECPSKKAALYWTAGIVSNLASLALRDIYQSV